MTRFIEGIMDNMMGYNSLIAKEYEMAYLNLKLGLLLVLMGIAVISAIIIAIKVAKR